MRLDIDVPSPLAEALPGSSSPTLFTFQAASYAAGQLRVLSFQGREAVSRPFRLDISVDVD
jgi:uncharacterized protein involved in type VI secretion and phage assembly